MSRSHLGQGSDYNLQHEAVFLRSIHAGPYADPSWQVPSMASLQSVKDCTTTAKVSLHGDNRYTRLALAFSAPVRYELIVWFDGEQSPGLLIATRADTLAERLQQSMRGFTAYAGFAKQMPRQSPEAVFAREGASWCRLSLLREQ